jgi:hypothetical protein
MSENQKMNVNEIDLNGVVYVRKDSVSGSSLAPSVDGMKPVLIRSYAAGVHFGYLKSQEDTLSGRVVVLTKTRRVWYWDGAASLSQMALEGVSKPEKCKFSVELDSNEIVNVIEILPLTDKALLNLYKVAVWKQ